MFSKIVSRNHNNNFDFLRLAGALTVIVNHSHPILTGIPHRDFIENLSGSIGFGTFMFDIFFVISGYLIAQSFFARPTFLDFFKARVLRIMPAFAVSMLCCVFIVGTISTTLSLHQYFTNAHTWRYFINFSLFKLQFTLPGVFLNHPMTSVNGSIWSLAYEFTLYIALFLFGIIGFLKPTKLNLVLHVLIFSTMIFLNSHSEMTTITTFGIESSRMVNLYVYFFFGAALFILREKFQPKWFLVLLLFVCWVFSFHTKFCALVSFFFIPIFTVWFGFLPIKFPKWITSTGDYSYGLYVYSFPIQQLIIGYTAAHISIYSMVMLSILCTFPVAILSYHFIELPALQFKSKYFLQKN